MYNPYGLPTPYLNNGMPGYPDNAYNKPQSSNVLPPQQVIQVNGKASIDTLQMSPNSSVLIMDTSGDIVWLCVSEGVGRVTANPFDISPHTETPPIDMTDVLQRVTNLEQLVANMEGKINGKPNDAVPTAESKSDSVTEQPFANKKYGGRT